MSDFTNKMTKTKNVPCHAGRIKEHKIAHKN